MTYSIWLISHFQPRRCTLNNQDCLEDLHSDAVWDYSTGYCYSFNHRHLDDLSPLPIRTLHYAGGENVGLKLVLDTGHQYGLDGRSIFNGALLKVHPPQINPFIRENYIYVPAGFWTLISLKKRIVKRTPAPHGNCKHIDQAINEKLSFYAQRWGYSYRACIKTCIQTKAIHKYGCCLRTYPCNPLSLTQIFGETLPQNLSECAEYYEEDDHYYVPGIEIMEHCNTVCPAPCTETHYDITSVTHTHWPVRNTGSADEAMQHLGLPYGEMMENVLGVSVFYESLEVEIFESTPKYDLSALLSNLGGVFGLFTGFSVLTTIELITLLVDIVCLYFCKNWKSHRTVSKSQWVFFFASNWADPWW